MVSGLRRCSCWRLLTGELVVDWMMPAHTVSQDRYVDESCSYKDVLEIWWSVRAIIGYLLVARPPLILYT